MTPRRLRRLVLVLMIGSGGAAALGASASAPPPAAELSLRDAVVLGVTEGVTEYLPISSTGHLIIASQLLGLESDVQLKGGNGRPLWFKPAGPGRPAGVPLTRKLAADTYTVIIQVGAIAAVVLLYWPQLMSMLLGLVGRSEAGLRLLRNIVLATIPAGVFGLALHEWIDEKLFSVWAVIGAQVAGAFLMLWAERWRRLNSGLGTSDLVPADLTPPKAVFIGFAQCLALWPGTSRSMVTIIGGYLTGLNPVRSAEFSFLIGLPTLTGAALLKAVKTGPAMVEVFGWGHMLIGCLVAAGSAALAVRFLVNFLSRHGLGLFAYYRLVLAVALAAVFLL